MEITLAAFVGSSVLSIAFYSIYKNEKKNFLLDWTIAWLMLSIGYVFVSCSAYTGNIILLKIGSEVFGLFHAIFLLKGTAKYIEKNFSKIWYWQIGIIILWIFASDFLKIPDKNLPQFLFFAYVHFITGVKILKSRNKGAGKYIAGFALITWSIHKLDYPFVHGVPVLTEFGYLFSQFLALLTGIGALIFFYEQNKRKLSLSEEKFNFMFEDSPVSISTSTVDGILTDVNNSYIKLFGYDRKEELIGKPSLELIAPENREDLLEKLLKNFDDSAKSYRTNGLRKDGTKFPLEIELGRIKLPEGERSIAYLRDISELKKSEEKKEKLKKEKEKLLKNITDEIENMPIGYILHDKDLYVTYLNSEAERIFGYSKSELIGKKPLDEGLIVPKSSKKIVEERFLKTRLNSGKVVGINQNITKDERIIYCEWTNQAVYNDKGELENILTMVSDVTDRIKSESALAESERKYRQLFEEDLTGHVVTNPEGEILEFNSKLVEQLCFDDNQDFAKRNFKEFYIDIKDREKVIEKIKNDGKAESFEIDLKRKDGSIVTFLENATAKFDELGNIKELRGYFFEITDRKRTEIELENYRLNLEEKVIERTEELKFSEERFRSIAETSQDIIIRIDEHDQVLYLNNSAKHFFKQINRISVGNKVVEGVSNKNKSIVEEYLGKVKRLKKPLDMELLHPNGIWLDYHIIPEIENGTVKTIMAYGRDISKRKNVEEKITDALQKEREINEMKSAFVSMISHEFRTPLTALLSSVEILEMYGRNWSEEKYNRHIDVIRRSVDNLTIMINDILFLNRAQAGKLELNSEPLDLYELIEDIINECKSFAAANHHFHLNYEPEKRLYYLDRTLIRNVVSNLISNAIKYSPKGGNIKVEVSDNNFNLSIQVEDEGRGIDDQDLKQIFEPFARGKNYTGIQGTGLGLSIVKKSLQLLKGNIEVKSELGNGSNFIVNLPLNGKNEKTIGSY